MSLYVTHKFGPNETLCGVLKKYNTHDASPHQIRMLLIRYNSLNGNSIPRLGQEVLIPVDFLPEPPSEGEAACNEHTTSQIAE